MNDILKAIEKYRKTHPEIVEIMKQFQISQDAYDRALASVPKRVSKTGSTYTLTTEGKYNVNVSKST